MKNRFSKIIFGLALYLVLSYLSRLYVVQAYRIPSGSMSPTLMQGDRIFVNKMMRKTRTPRRGNLVVFLFPTMNDGNIHYGKSFVSRIIGLEGDQIEIRNKKLMVNGFATNEPYAILSDSVVYPKLDVDNFQEKWEHSQFSGEDGISNRDNFGPIVVPKGHLFVLGDNRDRAYDSRFWGAVPTKNIQGYPWVIYWPHDRFRKIL